MNFRQSRRSKLKILGSIGQIWLQFLSSHGGLSDGVAVGGEVVDEKSAGVKADAVKNCRRSDRQE